MSKRSYKEVNAELAQELNKARESNRKQSNKMKKLVLRNEKLKAENRQLKHKVLMRRRETLAIRALADNVAESFTKFVKAFDVTFPVDDEESPHSSRNEHDEISFIANRKSNVELQPHQMLQIRQAAGIERQMDKVSNQTKTGVRNSSIKLEKEEAEASTIGTSLAINTPSSSIDHFGLIPKGVLKELDVNSNTSEQLITSMEMKNGNQKANRKNPGGDALNTVSAKKAKLCQQVTVLTPCKVNLSTQAGPSTKLVLSKSAAEKNTANNGESNDELNSKIEQRVTRLSQSAHGADFKNQPAQNIKTNNVKVNKVMKCASLNSTKMSSVGTRTLKAGSISTRRSTMAV